MASSGMLVLAVVLSMCVLPKSASSQGLFGGNSTGFPFSLSDLGSLEPGKINDNIDSLLKQFGSLLPSRVELGTIDPNFAYNCFLTGLDNGLYRDGDAFLEIPDTKAIFTFSISTRRLTTHCYWRKKVIFLLFRGTVRASTNRVSISAKISLELLPGAGPTLDQFRVNYMDRIWSDVSGAGFFNWIGEKIIDKLAAKSQDQIVRQIEVGVSERLQNLLEVVKLPSL